MDINLLPDKNHFNYYNGQASAKHFKVSDEPEKRAPHQLRHECSILLTALMWRGKAKHFLFTLPPPRHHLSCPEY